MIAALVVVYVFVAVGAIRFQVDMVKLDPGLMPGGGARAVVLRGFLWPMIVVLAIVVLLVVGVSEL